MPLATLQRFCTVRFFSCAFPFYFLTGEFVATLFLFRLVVGCASFSFRHWDAAPAPNPAPYPQPAWGPCSPLVCFEGDDNFFLGVLAVLKQHQSKIWCYLRRIVITNPAAMCPEPGSTHLPSLGEEVCSAATAQPWTCKAPFCKWIYLPVKRRVTLPSSPSFPRPLTSSVFTPCSWIVCVHWCWGAIPIAPLPEEQAGISVAVRLVLALVTLEIRGQLLEWAAWGAWDRSEISWADQKPEMFFWQPWSSLSWFMYYILSIYLAEEAHWGNRGWFVQAEKSMWFQRATTYQEIPPQMRYLQSHQSALRYSGKGSPGDSEQKMSGYFRGLAL